MSFRDFIDPLGLSNGNEIGLFTGLDPAGLFSEGGLAGGQSVLGESGQLIADPIDLFGIRAAQAREGLGGLVLKSAQENIDLQEQQLADIARTTEPFRKAATETALPTLSNLAFGGPVDFQPSQLFNRQLDEGRRGVLRGQAAGGAGVKSSRTFERLSDLVSGLASEDVGRFEQGNSALLGQGRQATNQLGQAGSQLTGNVSSIFSNLGENLNLQGQQRAQAELARAQTRTNAIQSLGSFATALL